MTGSAPVEHSNLPRELVLNAAPSASTLHSIPEALCCGFKSNTDKLSTCSTVTPFSPPEPCTLCLPRLSSTRLASIAPGYFCPLLPFPLSPAPPPLPLSFPLLSPTLSLVSPTRGANNPSTATTQTHEAAVIRLKSGHLERSRYAPYRIKQASRMSGLHSALPVQQYDALF